MQVSQRSILLPHPVAQRKSGVEPTRSRHTDSDTKTTGTTRLKGELLPTDKKTFTQRVDPLTVGTQKSTPEFERLRADPRLIDIRPSKALQSYQDTEGLTDGPTSNSQTHLDLYV